MRLTRMLLVGAALNLWLGTAYAVTGAQTAAQLNARYSNTPAQCVARTPAFNCSGVLLRSVSVPPNRPFWAITDPGSSTLRFDYVRKDRRPAPLNAAAGYVLFDRLTAVGLNKAYQGTQTPASAAVVQVNAEAAWAPAQFAVQGLFYDVQRPDGLPQAQRSQLHYFNATGVWLPVLRLQLDEPRGQVFGFSQQDQLYEGYRVTQRLNTRYGKTELKCRNGHSAFDCNGVLLRSSGVGKFRTWNPSPYSVKAGEVSFSYLRRDASIRVVVWPQGYLIRELSAPALYPLSLGCLYAADGATHYSGSANPCSFRGWCEQMNPAVISPTAWTAYTQDNPYASCSFRTDVSALKLMVDIRRSVPGLTGWNEVMVNTWPQDIAPQLALEAFFFSQTAHYLGEQPGVEGLSGGQLFQSNYLEDTGRFLPLVKLDVLAANGQPFTFDPNAQALQ